MSAKIQFFIGKGGVGKSTTSALTALNIAHNGHDALLVSMDPAHNLRDIFQRQFSEKSFQVMPGLAVKEMDIEYWMKVYLKATETQLKKVYRYQSAFNIQNYYNILKYSPGLEEYALLLAFENVLHTADGKDEVIFDMPPTAMTMRFLSLPSITLIWLEELLKLRSQIYEKKEIISKIKFGKREIEQDKVKTRLQSLIDENGSLQEHFTAASTVINLVVNNNPLSLKESVRIRNKLDDIGINIRNVILNKAKNGEMIDDLKGMFDGYQIRRFPHSHKDLYGVDSLKTYLLEFSDEMNYSPSRPNSVSFVNHR
jgi:arsenite-transporting ATPase